MEHNGRDNSGRFAAGHNGFKKPKTEFQRLTKNKIGDFLKEKLEDLPAIYEELAAKDKARLILACAEFFLPKIRHHEIELDEGFSIASVDLTRLSEKSLTEILTLNNTTNGISD